MSLLGPVDPLFRALSGRLKFTVRRHKLNNDSFSWAGGGGADRWGAVGDADHPKAGAHPPKRSSTLVSLSSRLKDLLGPVTRVKKKKNEVIYEQLEEIR